MGGKEAEDLPLTQSADIVSDPFPSVESASARRWARAHRDGGSTTHQREPDHDLD